MSYQLHCPNCSEAIPPENINVQQMAAVCPTCGAVFNFADNIARAQRKLKRRKSKKPDHITQTETDNSLKLDMPFLETLSYKIASASLGIVIALFYGAILAAVIPDNDPTDTVPMIIMAFIFLPLIFGSFGAFFAKHSVEVNDEELKHEVHLGVPVYQRKMNIDDVSDVSIEEMSATRESVASARYNLFADRYDGRQDMFIQNLPDETATYIQQALSTYLQADNTDDAMTRLRDDTTDETDHLHNEQNQLNQLKS